MGTEVQDTALVAAAAQWCSPEIQHHCHRPIPGSQQPNHVCIHFAHSDTGIPVDFGSRVYRRRMML